IFLLDVDAPIERVNLHFGIGNAANEKIDFGLSAPPLILSVAEVAEDMSIRRLGMKPKLRFTGNEHAGVSSRDRGVECQGMGFPPVVDDIDAATSNRNLEIGETIVAEEATATQLGTHLVAAHPVDQQFSIAELHPFDVATPGQNNDVIDRTRTIG